MTFTGQVVSDAEWRDLSDLERYGPREKRPPLHFDSAAKLNAVADGILAEMRAAGSHHAMADIIDERHLDRAMLCLHAPERLDEIYALIETTWQRE